jgi:hypothetical protein
VNIWVEKVRRRIERSTTRLCSGMRWTAAVIRGLEILSIESERVSVGDGKMHRSAQSVGEFCNGRFARTSPGYLSVVNPLRVSLFAVLHSEGQTKGKIRRKLTSESSFF